MDISNEVTAAIEKHLPGAVGEVLRKRLEQAERDANAAADFSAALREARTVGEGWKKDLNAATEELAKHTKLAERENAVRVSERNLRVQELTLQLAAEQRVTKAMQETLAGLVRNTEWRTDVRDSHDRTVVVPGSGGGGYTNSVTETDTRTEKRSAA